MIWLTFPVTAALGNTTKRPNDRAQHYIDTLPAMLHTDIKTALIPETAVE